MKKLADLLPGNGDLLSLENLPLSRNQNRTCRICGGPARCDDVGFVRKDVDINHPDFGKAFACPARPVLVSTATIGALNASSSLVVLSHLTVDNFLPQCLGLSPETQKNL